jgi:hypothetical protein
LLTRDHEVVLKRLLLDRKTRSLLLDGSEFPFDACYFVEFLLLDHPERRFVQVNPLWETI